jgi:hypothetical protein
MMTPRAGDRRRIPGYVEKLSDLLFCCCKAGTVLFASYLEVTASLPNVLRVGAKKPHRGVRQALALWPGACRYEESRQDCARRNCSGLVGSRLSSAALIKGPAPVVRSDGSIESFKGKPRNRQRDWRAKSSSFQIKTVALS